MIYYLSLSCYLDGLLHVAHDPTYQNPPWRLWESGGEEGFLGEGRRGRLGGGEGGSAGPLASCDPVTGCAHLINGAMNRPHYHEVCTHNKVLVIDLTAGTWDVFRNKEKECVCMYFMCT